MDGRRNALEHSSTKASDQVTGKRRLKFAGGISVLVLVLMLATDWPYRESNAARLTAPQNDDRTDAGVAIDYFPAKFGSPSTNSAPEEHIQAF